MKKSLFAFAWLIVVSVGLTSRGQSTTTYEDGPDGVKYAVTRQVVQRTIPSTEIQTREQKVYHPQVTTEYQSYQHTYLTPVTQYQYVPHLRNWWNPFTGAYWTHDLQPVTYWQARPATVQVPVAKTNWVETTQTTQVPVTTYRTVAGEVTSRVPVSAAPSSATATSVAVTPIGGQQMQSDPPRAASNWATSGTYRR
jgi:hypothetical protein